MEGVGVLSTLELRLVVPALASPQMSLTGVGGEGEEIQAF